MQSTKKIRFLRGLERLLLVFTMLIVVLLAVFSANGNLGVQESYAGGGIVVAALLIVFLIQHSIDSSVAVVESQANYLQDDALAALFDRSPVAYLIVDKQGRVVEGNVAAVKLLKGEVAALPGLPFFNLLAGMEEDQHDVLISKIKAGLTINDLEVPMQTLRADESVWVLLSVFAYRNAGQRLLTLVNVTEQKKVDTAKSEFVALATHQLRTPIAAIRWNVELLEKRLMKGKTDSLEKYADKIERNTLRMIDLINDFLSVSKLEMGTYAAKTEPTDLTDFVDSILDEFAEKITQKQIKIVRTDDPPHVVIEADSRLFHIVVSNLVSNAVKYLNPAGQIELQYSLSGNVLQLAVADDGIGIPSDELGDLFTKFYRASNARSHQTQGTGLGLYIVKESVKQMGGEITVESEAGQGARFVVTLPVQVVSAGETS